MGRPLSRPASTAIGVTAEGTRDSRGIWIDQGGEGAKFRLQVLTEIRNRGTGDARIVVYYGLKGLPEAIQATWPLAVTQTSVLHLPAPVVRGLGRHSPRPAPGVR